MKVRLFFVGCIAFLSASAQVQVIDPEQLSAFYPKQVQAIGVKLHRAMLQGAVKSYYSDSFTRPITASDYKLLGSRIIPLAIQNWRNPSDPTDIVDTNYLELLSEYRLLEDLFMTFDIVTGKNASKTMVLRAVAPVYSESVMNFRYNLPVAWLKAADLKRVLSKDELAFLTAYSWYKSFDMPIRIKRGYDTTEGHKEYLVNLHLDKVMQASDVNTSAILGSVIRQHLGDGLFQPFKVDEFNLIEKDTVVTAKAFQNRFSTLVVMQIQNPANPGDPEDLKDTMFYTYPISFDDIGLEQRGKKVYVRLYQKQQYYSSINTTTFIVPLSSVKKYLYPAEYELLKTVLPLYNKL